MATCTHCKSLCVLRVASFPGLPRFFCSSVSVENNTYTDAEGGRPGNEAILRVLSPLSKGTYSVCNKIIAAPILTTDG